MFATDEGFREGKSRLPTTISQEEEVWLVKKGGGEEEKNVMWPAEVKGHVIISSEQDH
jgi:hypothetical protein